MGDAELISLLQSQTPLSKISLDEIRDRLAESQEFRELVANGDVETRERLCRELDLEAEAFALHLRSQPTRRRSFGPFLAVGVVVLTITAAFLRSLFIADVEPDHDVEPDRVASTSNDNSNSTPSHREIAGPEDNPAIEDDNSKSIDMTSPSGREDADNTPADRLSPNVTQESVAVTEVTDPAPDFESLSPFLEPAIPLNALLVPSQSSRGNGRFEKQGKDDIADLRGTFRLTKSWNEDSLLRLEFGETPRQLDLSFWRGNEGVLFRHYRHSTISWAAYKVTRSGSKPDPTNFILLDTDSGVFKRLDSLRLELRHQGGQLVVASLGRVLMVVPFPELPKQVFLAATKARIRAIDIQRSGPIPIQSHEFPTLTEIDRPADEQWETRLPEGAKVSDQDDGAILLTAERPGETAFVALPFRDVGFRDVAFLIESPTPQTGVYFGTKHRHHSVGFFEETVRRKTVLEFAEGRSWQTTMKVDERVTPYVPNRIWVRLRAGLNSIAILTSHDGKRWFLASAPVEHRYGALTEFGIYAAHGNKPRSITLKKIIVRHLPNILSMADPGLLAQTPTFAGVNYGHEWFRIASAAMPKGVSIVEWRRACVVKALSQTLAISVMSPLWAELFRDGLTRPDWADKQREEFIREMLAIVPVINRRRPPFPFRVFEEIERQRFHDGQPSLINTFTEAVHVGNSATREMLDVFPYGVFRLKMVDDFNHGRWQDIHADSLAFRFHGRTIGWRNEHIQTDSFIEWLAAQAIREVETARLPAPRQNVEPVVFPAHPLQQAVNKETYNFFAELGAHLDAGDFGSAAEVVLKSSGKRASGLLPVSHDTELFLSSSLSIKTAVEKYTGLAEALDRNAGRIELRVSQAHARRDWTALRQIEHWFPGTTAASYASQHLGDWMLAQGNYSAAIQHFAQAMKSSAVARRELRARSYLAQALGGRLARLDLAAGDVDLDLPETVTMGDASMTRGGFISLLSHVQREVPSHDDEQRDLAAGDRSPILSPSDITIVPWGEASFGAQQYVNRRTNATIHGDRMFVSDGMELACFNVNDGHLDWHRRFCDRDRAEDQPLSHLTPIVIGDGLFARMETNKSREQPRLGPRIVRFEPSTGKIKRQSRPGVLSEPLLVNGMLVALTGDVNLAAPQFELSVFDPETLDEVRRSRLLTSAPYFSREQYPTFQLVRSDNALIATGAGCTAQLDLDGKIGWLRKHPWNPPRRFDRIWARRGHPKPVVHRGRVFVTQPATTQVECLELTSGRQVWRRTFDTPLTMTRGSHGLVVATDHAIHCLDFETGNVVWTNNTPFVSPAHLHFASRSDDPNTGTITFVCKATIREQRFIPAVAWLDSATGIELHRSLLAGSERQTPVVGAFISDGKRVWLPYAGDKFSGKMQLLELKMQPVKSVRPIAAYPFEDWNFHPDINISKAWKSMFPTWRLTMHRHDTKTVYRSDLNGEPTALITSLDRDWPTQIVRQLELPERACTLSMRVGHLSQPWLLSVRVNQSEIHSQEIGTTGKSGWTDVEVDLTPHTGKPIWLVIEANSQDNNYACWKRLVIESK